MAWLEMAIACRRDGRVSEVFIRRLAACMARGSAHDMSRKACNVHPGTRMHFLSENSPRRVESVAALDGLISPASHGPSSEAKEANA